MQTFCSTRGPLNEEAFPFLSKLHVATDRTQASPLRTVQELHARLREAESLPTVPFRNYGPDERLFNCSAWYSLAMLAASELPDIPFHVLLSTRQTVTALQDVITQRRTSYAYAGSAQQIFHFNRR